MRSWVWSMFLRRCRVCANVSSLPFVIQNDCALGLEVNAYFDELCSLENPYAAETKKRAIKRNKEMIFSYVTDYEGDLQKVFSLWDALYSALKTGGDLFTEKRTFDQVDQWLKPLR